MPFVKLDCNMLNSTLWFERIAREVFITSLLMAEPFELEEETDQIKIDSLDSTGWKVPAGKYGFVPAAGIGILRRAMLMEEEIEAGYKALELLGSPEISSRTPEFDGRRMVRINGGFLILNFDKYRQRDYTAAIRSKRYRDKKRHAVSTARHGVALRNVTEAEAEGEAEGEEYKKKKKELRGKPSSREEVIDYVRTLGLPETDGHYYFDKWEGNGYRNGQHKIRDWRGVIRSHKAGGYCPSQKRGLKPSSMTSEESEIDAWNRKKGYV